MSIAVVTAILQCVILVILIVTFGWQRRTMRALIARIDTLERKAGER